MLGGGPLDDFDRDGVSDGGEYLADTDPVNPGDWLRIVAVRPFVTSNTVSWTARPTRLYRIEATNRLGSAGSSWTDAGPGLLGPPASTTATWGVTSPGTTAVFYRVQAVVPLTP